ncbi:MAG TPA: N-6 DNA methylase [Thiobacillaceae bacterium]|nr:N-6 DNA methylase [Thiobacillaceae bacterium]
MNPYPSQASFPFGVSLPSDEVIATGKSGVSGLSRAGKQDKALGQVFTPVAVARQMARWVTSMNPRAILDPAAGLGGLLQACHALCPAADLLGIELDKETLDEAKGLAPAGTRLIAGDYLHLACPQADAIIANPPYVKAHHIGLTEQEWRALDSRFGLRLDRLSNLYVPFLLKVWADLRPGGRAAVIFPAEWMNANFGVPFKTYLRDVMNVAGMAVFDPARNVFPDALTTSCILFLDKRRGEEHRWPAAVLESENDLPAFVDALLRGDCQSSWTDIASWPPEEKWLNRLCSDGYEDEIDPYLHSHRLGDFFRCMRGIATGANAYFCLPPSEIEAHGLSERHFDPCVCRASDVEGLIFGQQEANRLAARDKRCRLLNPRELDRSLSAYLEWGDRQGIPGRHLPSHRPVWYLPEGRLPAAIWVGVFSRGATRFILNQAGWRNLTCYHGLYPLKEDERIALLAWLYLNSSAGRKAYFRVNRFYGDGLLKLEPSDVEALPCPDFGALAERVDVGGLMEHLRPACEAGPAACRMSIDDLAAGLFRTVETDQAREGAGIENRLSA